MTDTDVRRIEDKVDNVHLILAELKGSLSPTLEKLTEKQTETEKQIEDHESRIRGLERFRFSVPSLAVLAILLDAALGIYFVLRP